ncbi:ImmA/IrrE family metallo-endopeptidase [Cutibacterium sp. V970]|uniref:ImmA/IrrE family metallo-endopeptidase n=1 Tax=Cutibacterium sp. V970 TaxID=3446481 RepID=UPI003EE1A1D7
METIANFTRVPFGYFFFSEPPYEELPIPDFRVGRGHHVEASVDLLETIGLNQRRQAWYEDYLTDFNDPESLDFVGSARGMAPAEAAVLMTKVLRHSVSERKDLRTADEARRYLVEAFEDLGGLVVMNSMVGNNTHQMLSLDEFRGFTLHSQFAPLVFVNSNDTKAGQVFSLLHEFAHVWRGEGGVSQGGDPLRERNTDHERWCDAVAACIAVPADDLRMNFDPHIELTEALAGRSVFVLHAGRSASTQGNWPRSSGGIRQDLRRRGRPTQGIH